MADFIRARTEDQFRIRRDMILAACEEIYFSGGYVAVTFNTVSAKTSFTRPALYNYYKNRDEMLLDLVRKLYSEWRDGLFKLIEENENVDREGYCTLLSDYASENDGIFKLFTDMHLIEENCELDHLVEAKKDTDEFLTRITEFTRRTFPKASDEQIADYLNNAILIFSAIYPFTHRSQRVVDSNHATIPEVSSVNMREMLYRVLMNATAGLE
ncbi:MAG: TetR/AcrR family transcriptional regulator [archaeon]|nr:TetR/AcrR family transcriptional regulator [archaeon]